MKDIVAINDHVIGKEIIKTETESGIIIPENAAPTTPQLECEVVSVGETVETIQRGDIIYCHQQGGQALLIEGKMYRVLKIGEIYGRAARYGD